MVVGRWLVVRLGQCGHIFVFEHLAVHVEGRVGLGRRPRRSHGHAPPPPMHNTFQSLWKSEAWMSAPYSGGRMPTVRQYLRSTYKKGRWGVGMETRFMVEGSLAAPVLALQL